MREKGDSAFDDVVDEETTQDAKQEESNEQADDSSTERSKNNGTGSVEDSDPGFPFSGVEQHPIYLKPDTWKGLQDTKYYTEGELLEQFGVRNAETREFDEAVIQLVVEELSPALIAKRIVENRGFE